MKTTILFVLLALSLCGAEEEKVKEQKKRGVTGDGVHGEIDLGTTVQVHESVVPGHKPIDQLAVPSHHGETHLHHPHQQIVQYALPTQYNTIQGYDHKIPSGYGTSGSAYNYMPSSHGLFYPSGVEAHLPISKEETYGTPIYGHHYKTMGDYMMKIPKISEHRTSIVHADQHGHSYATSSAVIKRIHGPSKVLISTHGNSHGHVQPSFYGHVGPSPYGHVGHVQFSHGIQPLSTKVVLPHKSIDLGTNVHEEIVIHKKIGIPVPKPYPVHVEKRIPVPVPKAVAVYIDKPYPVHVAKPYPVLVEKPVPYPVLKHFAVPYKVAVKVPINVPVAVPVAKPYPVLVHKKVPVFVPEPVIVKKPVVDGKWNY